MSHTSHQDLLLTSITNYFDKKPELKKHLADIIHGKYIISLRVIDWFITHYTRLHNVIYWIDDKKNRLVEDFNPMNGNNLRKVHLYLEYRAQLKSYTKLNFDPFRRHNRITFVINHPHDTLETTVGQLNFFRWAFQNHLIEYICNHLVEIEENMAKFIHDRKSSSQSVSGDGQIANRRKKDRHSKTTRISKKNTDIIIAPCCLHFS